MALTKFKYTGGDDRGINPNKQITLYNIVFPVGKAVEVPDSLVHKMRTKGDFEEVSGSIDLNEAEKQKDVKLSSDEIEELKQVKAREDARIAKIQEDAKLGR